MRIPGPKDPVIGNAQEVIVLSIVYHFKCPPDLQQLRPTMAMPSFHLPPVAGEPQLPPGFPIVPLEAFPLPRVKQEEIWDNSVLEGFAPMGENWGFDGNQFSFSEIPNPTPFDLAVTASGSGGGSHLDHSPPMFYGLKQDDPSMPVLWPS